MSDSVHFTGSAGARSVDSGNPTPANFYQRALELHDGTAPTVVYAVQTRADAKPDPVPMIAGFSAGWRPTENPGQCLAVQGAGAAVILTHVPRSQFRHYERISRAEALALYPDLLR